MPAAPPQRYLLTAALPYANGPVHIGHLAGAYLPADLFARYLRLKGREVAFVCGSDEMGVAIVMRARAEGITPQDVVDRYHPMIADAFERFGMSFDHYGRTSSAVHAETTQDFFRTLSGNDAFALHTEEQLYDPEAQLFLADRFVRGTCPTCGNPDAYGDQCERCGSTLSPKELQDPRSALTDATPVLKETTHWYLKLGDIQPKLEAWVESREGWKPNVLGQIGSWLADGLRDRAITRDVPWGVDVPQDVAEAAGVDVDGKVIYVWFDAPIGYISATKEWAAEQGEPEAWKTYWQDEGTALLHFIGKDNIVFHGLMFPAMLMQHGGFVLPQNVPANEFLNLEGQKLSTSRNWAVWAHEYFEAFPPETGGADLLRYALAATLPETKDADFSWADFQQRANAELADVLGNFVNRTLTFATRFFDGVVPPLENPSEADRAALAALAEAPAKIGAAYEAFRLREAVFETMNLARVGNKYFNDTEPWHTRKSDKQACANTVHVCLQLCASLAVLLDPVVPRAAGRLRAMLNLTGIRPSTPQPLGADRSAGIGWDDAAAPLLETGHTLGEAGILFTKVEDEAIAEQVARLEASAPAPEEEAEPEPEAQPYAEPKPTITFDDFSKLDLRVGVVTEAAPVKKADRLLHLTVDLGYETRSVLAGIAETYAPEDIVGRRVVLVANLAPRKMRGVVSEGMVLMAEDRAGNLMPVAAESEPGAVVR